MDILIEDGTERKHKQKLQSLISSSKKSIDIATAYLTETALLKQKGDVKVRLLTSISANDILSGSVSLDAISLLFKQGIEIRLLDPDNNHFHPKVYIFDHNTFVITSANFTRNAMENNIEIGVSSDSPQVSELVKWYASLWSTATPLTGDMLEDLINFQNKHLKTALEIKKIKNDYNLLEINYRKINFVHQKYKKSNFFICNSNRKYSARNNDGSYFDEELMLASEHVIAWESYRYVDHMKRVVPGDIIFLYAKKTGVIAIGEALERANKVPPEQALKKSTSTNEWKIPVRWLTPKDDRFEIDIPDQAVQPTFLDISADKYGSLRDKVMVHFEHSLQK
ncbi:phospholipase D family protein [Pseudoalteromonas luteoviolacea]|uniref:phospholipase D family protein n=1 Tax=Pseudoalteromonas luteoviolacea TaxID=43657 RepID=UPI001B36199D|nr:phospholipase D family protein [Pseudoalteromonas luteoviolacea]MBQ4837696.1 phospholipase D family protein [Pseudoalteromonas luteoviolacea]